MTPGPCLPTLRPGTLPPTQGCFIGSGNVLGQPVSVDSAANCVFGYVLVNDWSARDVQKWEYVPLGPFNSKNFVRENHWQQGRAPRVPAGGAWRVAGGAPAAGASCRRGSPCLLMACSAGWPCHPSSMPPPPRAQATSISPWVVTPEALAPFAQPAPPQEDPQPLPYLRQAGRTNYDVQLEVAVLPAGTQRESVVARSNLRTLYWTVPQVLLGLLWAGAADGQAGDVLP